MDARLARRGLIVLTAINLVNYLDRYVPAALGPSLRAALQLSDTQFGLLTSGFIVVYMLAAPAFGGLGDRGSRPRLIAVGIFVWSVATALGGLAWGFASLLVARAAVGIGEAVYGTIAPTLLADYYSPAVRGRIFSIFYAAIPVGSALSYVVSGQMNAHFGWRSAFIVAGVPGLLLAALALRLEDPPRGSGEVSAPSLPLKSGAYAALVRNGPYVVTVLGYAAYTFALGGMAAFMPMFLTRVRGLTEATATTGFGGILVVTGFVGTAIGGWLGDALLRRTRRAYLWVSGIATLLAAPLVLVGLTWPTPAVYWGSIIAAEVLLFASTGPINSAIVNAVAPEIRATAVALSILAIHIFGDVPSPTILGAISDRTSLGEAVLIIPVAVLVSGVIWTYGAWRGGRAVTPRAPAA